MGVVYKCHDTVLDRVVAVKQMAGEADDDSQLRARFTQEARAAARLNHNHIITIYELHESETELAIVMELLEGVDLATLIKHKTPLPIEAKLNMMAQVCDGLDYAHARGIVHRDIKPANLHVSPSGVVKILDFGIARLASSKMTGTGGLIGTPDYMSPEQVMAGTIDARSDLFATGAVLYELVAGAKPFVANSITALLMQILREPHVPLAERAPDTPPAVADLVERLLAKAPDDRPASAREVHEALLALATVRPLFDAQTVATLSRAVTEETLRPRTPRPASRPSVRSASAAKADVSSSKLASLAIEQGRALRQTGDLAGAMKVFRSVLELSPANTEALSELEETERAVASLTSAARASSESSAVMGWPVAPAPPGVGTAPPSRNARSLGLAAALILILAAGGVGGYFLLSSDDDQEVAPALAMPPLPGGDESRPAATAAPLLESQSPAPATPAPPAPAPAPSRPAENPTQPRVARAPVATAAPAPVADPAPEPPPAPVIEPPAPAPPPAATVAPAVPAPVVESVVRHYHSRSLRRGFSRGYCDGTLQLLADGFYFRTTTSSDGRKDDAKITFKEIDDVEVEDDRVFIEGEEQNWEFGGARDLLQRIRQHIKDNKKDER